ncbi:hypothetical protein [Mesorhizobium sp. ES1-3]|uniref:hypothetical protein n=1 Tax=Mesorhizobium sp. ES1-3 TaxID=2876628 RepID=UPI001CCCE060|nr:hypothetical protein [Mesorhizobium sp. ES1-3]MBZ9673004.1 hypothetical protein [Mesorhizobium sp. ES1-3]
MAGNRFFATAKGKRKIFHAHAFGQAGSPKSTLKALLAACDLSRKTVFSNFYQFSRLKSSDDDFMFGARSAPLFGPWRGLER